MKKVRLVFMIFMSFAFLLLASSCLSKHNKCVEYLSRYEHNENIAYVDSGAIYFHNTKIKLENGINGENILYISSEKIYLHIGSSIYVTDYNFSNLEKMHTFERVGTNSRYTMYNQNFVCYEDSKGKLVYFIEESVEMAVDEFPCDTEYVITKDGSSNPVYYVTDKKTNETKKINTSNNSKIFELEQAKYLEKLIALPIDNVKEYDGEIYVNCVSDFIVTTYKYDFETETYTFVDWTEAFGNCKMFFVKSGIGKNK